MLRSTIQKTLSIVAQAGNFWRYSLFDSGLARSNSLLIPVLQTDQN
jgi:hypothetical protein